MPIRYLAAVLVTSLGLASAPTDPAAAPHCHSDLRAVYSPRALRHMRVELQLRLLEERRRQLQLAYSVLARHGSPKQLLKLPDDAEMLAQGKPDVRMKHLSPKDATSCW